MRKKEILCAVGIVLLFLLGLGSCLGNRAAKPKPAKTEPEGEARQEEPAEPKVELYGNVYLTDVENTYLSFFDGEERTYPISEEKILKETAGKPEGSLADIVVTDGVVTDIYIRGTEKVSGKVLSVEPGSGVELEERGFLPFAEDVRFYTLYGSLRLGEERDIRIGYRFADFILENGAVCGVLLTGDETMEYIRVLIKTSGYTGNFHEAVALACDTDYTLQYEKNGVLSQETYRAGESITITPESPYFTEEAGGRVKIVPAALTGKISLLSVERGQGTPAYRGTIEISCMDEGLLVINEVLLEEYLYGVVPSEMPSSYPLEALKAQAVCARTYAYARMLHSGLSEYGAHVDDSTSFQVYNNISEQNSTTTAVRETAGELLFTQDGELADTYYYSTSCGFGSDEHVWKSETAAELPYLSALSVSAAGMAGEELPYTGENMTQEAVFAQFLKEPPESDFERLEPWYRWSYEVKKLDEETILGALQSRYAANSKLVLTYENGEYVSKPVEKLGEILSLEIVKRNAGGSADELVIEGSKETYKVISELNIRYVLCDGRTRVVRQDGSEVEMPSLLPSAFFVMTPVVKDDKIKGYLLSGGGFGHGAGMSQNGARNMAEAGCGAEEILEYFYQGSTVRRVEE